MKETVIVNLQYLNSLVENQSNNIYFIHNNKINK